MPPRDIRAAMLVALSVALAACSGPPVSFENPPLGADGKSRILFVQVNTPGLFIGELYTRQAGSAYWGDDIVFMHNIYPGQGRAFDLNDGSGGCVFDLRRRVFGGGGPPQFQEQLGVNLCDMNKRKQAWLL